MEASVVKADEIKGIGSELLSNIKVEFRHGEEAFTMSMGSTHKEDEHLDITWDHEYPQCIHKHTTSALFLTLLSSWHIKKKQKNKDLTNMVNMVIYEHIYQTLPP